MNPQHFGNLLHRFELGSHSSSAPGIKEFTGPSRGTVSPESLKIFLEQIGPDGSEVAREQVLQFIHLLSVRFSGLFNRHQRLLVKSGSLPLRFNSLASFALISSMALLMWLMI